MTDPRGGPTGAAPGAAGRPTRITLVTASLRAGGAERVLSILANALAADGREVTVLIWDGDPAAPAYDLDPRVKRRFLGLIRRPGGIAAGLFGNIQDIFALRRAIRDGAPEAVISFIDRVNVIVLLASGGLGVPVIVSERVDPAAHAIPLLWRWLRRWTYPRAFRLVVQTRRAAAYFPPGVRRKTVVIPNPVPAPPVLAPATPGSTVAAMGRLVRQKGFDILLRSFARIADSHKDWTLRLAGEGPLRSDLEGLCRDLGLAGRVSFAGPQGDPAAFIRAADLFVVPSRYEGFPNVLCEAMSWGRAVIASDCPSGPAEIVRAGVDGVLVPVEDESALAAAMDRLMASAAERRRLGENARAVAERFSVEKVMDLWRALLAEAE